MSALLWFGLFGLAYGVVLQRSGFCFAKAGFELCFLRSREAFNGVLAGVATATIGIALVVLFGLAPLSHLLVIPFGAGTVVGGILFGMGMSLAGMCATGTLLRIGEGYAVAWLSLLGFIMGAALDPFRYFMPERWQWQFVGIWLGGRVGVFAAAALTLLFLAVLWSVVFFTQGGLRRYKKKSLRVLFAPPIIGGILLGFINTAQTAYATPWTIAYPLALISHTTTLPEALPLIVLNGGLVLGALVSAAFGERYRIKWPRRKQEVLLTLGGGVLMGWGVQLAKGCSIGGAFSAFASLSLSAWLFVPALLLGTWVGTQVIRRIM